MINSAIGSNMGARGVLLFAILLGSLGVAAPAFAKHPATKPSQLWNQYPLNVQPGVKASQSPSPKASQRVAPTTASKEVRDVRSRAGSDGNGTLFVAAGVAVLLLGIAFSVKKRPKTPDIKVGRSGDLVAAPTEGTASEHLLSVRANGSSSPEPKRNDQTPTADPSVATESDPRTKDAAGIAAETQDDRAARPAAGQGQSPKEAVPVAVPEAAAGPAANGRERVRLGLSDGRSLEGWRRDPGSEDEQLLILDVIAAFDSEGNEAPTSRADSFILRNEITSLQKLEDS
jgi:hypothetical protein